MTIRLFSVIPQKQVPRYSLDGETKMLLKYGEGGNWERKSFASGKLTGIRLASDFTALPSKNMELSMNLFKVLDIC